MGFKVSRPSGLRVEGSGLNQHSVVTQTGALSQTHPEGLNLDLAQSLGFRFEGLGFRVRGSGFRVQGLGLRA